MSRPLILINAVGLTRRLLPFAARLNALAGAGWSVPLREVVPAVTCTAQATLLTGQNAEGHGIVGNGWLCRDTGEVRFWQQSNRLLQAEPLYQTARRRAARAAAGAFRCAKLFWWFNQGAAVDISVTPKPYYGADGNKVFGIHGTPAGLTERLEQAAGPFPLSTPSGGRWPGCPARTGSPAVRRRGRRAASSPDLTLVYLPHLDYDPQRFGPEGCDLPRLVGELDAACAPLLDAARSVRGPRLGGQRVWPRAGAPAVQPNRALRQAGLLTRPAGTVRRNTSTPSTAGPLPSATTSWPTSTSTTRPTWRAGPRRASPGCRAWRRSLAGEERRSWACDHPRAGELVALSRAGCLVRLSFLAGRPPGPRLCPDGRHPPQAGLRPVRAVLRPAPVRGRTGRACGGCCRRSSASAPCSTWCRSTRRWCAAATACRRPEPDDQPLLIGDGPAPAATVLPLTAVHGLLLEALGLPRKGKGSSRVGVLN